MLRTLWAITKNAFLEITRQPVYGILVVVSMALIGLSPFIAMFTLMDDVKLVIDMGLATILLTGLALAVLSATQIMSREIESRTAGAVMSKPVSRFVFVGGKFLGVTLSMLLAVYLLTVILLITVRLGVPGEASYELDHPALLGELLPALIAIFLGMYCNYFYRWNFTSTAVLLSVPLYAVFFVALCLIDRNWELQSFGASFYNTYCDQVFLAAVLVFFCVWVISSVAVAVSTRLDVVPNVIICGGILFVGMVSRYLFGQYAEHSWAAWLAYRVVPYLQAFWVGDQLMLPEPYIPRGYVAMSAAYAALWCGAAICFAAFLFEQREVI